MAILEVKNICKSFDKTEVLKGVSFSMEKSDNSRNRLLGQWKNNLAALYQFP